METVDRARVPAAPSGAAVPSLTRWGVSAQADIVYRTLALFGTKDLLAVSRLLDLTPKQTSAALDELHGLGAVILVLEARQASSRTWKAAAPEKVVNTLRDRQARLTAAARSLQRQLSFLDIAGITLEGIRAARPILDVPTAKLAFHDVIATGGNEYLAMNPETAFTSASAKSAVPASQAALKRGVSTLSLGVPAAGEDESETYAAGLHAYGLQYRESPRQPVKLAIVDRQTAFFPIDPSANFNRGLWHITSPAIVAELTSFFLHHWESAMDPAPNQIPPSQALSEREREVIIALSYGDTDEMAAERLQLSARTIRYVIRDLMDRHNATSRFQLGLILGQQSDTRGEQ